MSKLERLGLQGRLEERLHCNQCRLQCVFNARVCESELVCQVIFLLHVTNLAQN